MPPSAPLPTHHHQPQVTEIEAGVVSQSPSPTATVSTPSRHEYHKDVDDEKWNNENQKREPSTQQSLHPSIPSVAGTAPTTQFIQPPVDVNSMWNSNSMMGMNPYNSFNPMNLSNSAYGNFGNGYSNGNMMMMAAPMLGTTTAGGPFSTITNYLLGIQNVIMSIGQVVQIISFNASSLQQLSESILAMIEHAIRSWHEQQQQQSNQRLWNPSTADAWNNNNNGRTPEEIQKEEKMQRRLRALRYTVTIALSYIGYSIIRKVFFPKQHPARHLHGMEYSQIHGNNNNNNTMMTTPSMYHVHSHNTDLYPPPPTTTTNYRYNHMTNPYWNSVPPSQQYQQQPPPLPYHY
jgi:hypothetical protein